MWFLRCKVEEVDNSYCCLNSDADIYITVYADLCWYLTSTAGSGANIHATIMFYKFIWWLTWVICWRLCFICLALWYNSVLIAITVDRRDIHSKSRAVSEPILGIWDLPELSSCSEKKILAEDCYVYALIFGAGWGGYFISKSFSLVSCLRH